MTAYDRPFFISFLTRKEGNKLFYFFRILSDTDAKPIPDKGYKFGKQPKPFKKLISFSRRKDVLYLWCISFKPPKTTKLQLLKGEKQKKRKTNLCLFVYFNVHYKKKKSYILFFFRFVELDKEKKTSTRDFWRMYGKLKKNIFHL